MYSKAKKKSHFGLKLIFAAAVACGVGGYFLTPHWDGPAAAHAPEGASAVQADIDAAVQQASFVRDLTPGETSLAQRLFGKEIDLTGVQILLYGKEREDTSSDVFNGDGKHIEVYGRKYYSDDYSKDPDGYNFSSFVHDMTQLLQNQKGGDWKHGNVQGYDYPLSSQWSFDDYGLQQQRAIMEDYARRFLHPDRHSRWLPDQYGNDREDTDPFLINLVEDRFPQAKAAREAFADVQTRPLTAGEVALVRSIFGDQVDPTIVRENFDPRVYGDVAAMTFSSKRIDFYGPKEAAADFSTDQNVQQYADFVHEMTHVWQFQHNWKYTEMTPKHYLYPLDTSKWRFSDYSIEQQAAMVEDYARYFLHPAHQMRWLPQTYGEEGARARADQLMKTVEDQFPAARQTRLAREAAGAKISALVAPAPNPAA